MQDKSTVKWLLKLVDEGDDPVFRRRRYESEHRARQGEVIDALIADGSQTDPTALRLRPCYQSGGEPCWSFGCPCCADRWALRLTRDAVRTSFLTSHYYKSFGMVATLATACLVSSAGTLDSAPVAQQEEFAQAVNAMGVTDYPVLVVPRLTYHEVGFRSIVGPHFRIRQQFIIFGYSASEEFVGPLKARILRHFDLSRKVDASLKIEPVVDPAEQFANLFGNIVPRAVTLLDNHLRVHELTQGLDLPRVAEVARWADTCLGPSHFGSHHIVWRGSHFLPNAQAVERLLRRPMIRRPSAALLK